MSAVLVLLAFQATLMWERSFDLPAAAFILYRQAGSSICANAWAALVALPEGVREYTDASLAQNVVYCYRMAVKNPSQVEEPPSNIVKVLCKKQPKKAVKCAPL